MAIYETSIKTREALLHAAGELAAEKGFHSVSTRAIADRARVNVGSIHYHFGSKEKLFEEVVRTVVKAWQDNPVGELISRQDLESRQGQAMAIRAIVHRNIALLFDREYPGWHCRVIFQVMRKKNSLQQIFKKEVIAPSHNAIIALLQRINPTLDRREAFLRILIMNTPVFFHADRMDFILTDLGEDKYSAAYLRLLEDIIVSQTQLSLGLPTC